MPRIHLKNQHIRRQVSWEGSGFICGKFVSSYRRGKNGRKYIQSIFILKEQSLSLGNLYSNGEDST